MGRVDANRLIKHRPRVTVSGPVVKDRCQCPFGRHFTDAVRRERPSGNSQVPAWDFFFVID